MAPELSAWNTSADDRIKAIAIGLHHNEFENEVPGLKTLLYDCLNPLIEVSKDDFLRRLLAVFKDSETDQTFENLLAKYTEDEQERLEEFLDGESLDYVSDDFVMGPSQEHSEEMMHLQNSQLFKVSVTGVVYVNGLSEREVDANEGNFDKFLHGLANLIDLHEGKDEIKIYKNITVQGEGPFVTKTPVYTCVPTSIAGAQRIIQVAKLHDMSVQYSGSRQPETPISRRNGHIFISMIGLENADMAPRFVSLSSIETAPTELEQIEILTGAPRQTGNTLVRIGAAVTNERLRSWCLKNNKSTLPMNAIISEITLGGSNAPLSGLIREIEYIDAHGKIKTVSNPDHLRAASGCFGLMGVVTRITLEFSPVAHASSSPIKLPVMKAVPPPLELDDKDIPTALFIPRTAEEKIQDQATFEQHANSGSYSEWSWFPFSEYAWVNYGDDKTEASNVSNSTNAQELFLSWVQTFTLNVLQSSPLTDKLSATVHLNEAATTLISLACTYTLPSKSTIQNVPSRNMELSIPLVAKPKQPSAVDYTTIQRAFWDALLTCYRHRTSCPQRFPLTMRITGSSSTLLSPQHHTTNTVLGTCTIQISTPHSVASTLWKPYSQAVLDKWTSYTYPNTGKRLNSRPSWAKDWKDLSVQGVPWAEKLKSESYKAEIAEFVRVLAEMGGESGWTLADVQRRFSNGFLDWLVFDGVKAQVKEHVPALPEVGAEVVQKLNELEKVVVQKKAVESLVVENKALDVGRDAAATVTTVEVTEIL